MNDNIEAIGGAVFALCMCALMVCITVKLALWMFS
jgi:hypothetical protein